MPHVERETSQIALNTGAHQWGWVWRDLGPDVACGGWFRKNALAFVRYGSVFTVNLDTGEVTDWGPHQGNSLFAGGGVWAVGNRYRDSWGPNTRWDQSEWVPYAVDNLTGAIAVLTADWQFCVYQGHADPAQATLTPMLSGIAEYQASWWDGILTLWCQGSRYHWRTGGTLTLVDTISPGLVAPGAEWAAGWNLGFSSMHGQVVWRDGDPEHALPVGWVYNYWPQVWTLDAASTVVTVIGSKWAGEVMGAEQVFTFDLLAKTLNGQPYNEVDLLHAAPDGPTPPPSITVPTYPKTDQAIGIGIIDEPGGPVIEASGWPLTGRGVATGFTCQHDSPRVVLDTFRIARDLRVPCYAYVDDLKHLANPGLIPPAPSGITYRVQMNGYPIAGEGMSRFEERVLAGFANIEARGFTPDQIDVMLCGFLGNRTEREVLDSHAVMYRLMTARRIQAAWIFNYERGDRDGLAHVPSLMESARRLRAASADWTHFPTVPPAAEDDLMDLVALTLPLKKLEKYHEWPDTHIAFRRGDGRWLRLVQGPNGEPPVVSWADASKKNEPGAPAGHHDWIWSDCAFEYVKGQGVAVANRGGEFYSVRVDLTR